MLKKLNQKKINIIIQLILLLFCVNYLFLNYNSYKNIDDRGYYSSFYDSGWFYHPIKNYIKGKGFTSKEISYYKQTNNLFGTHSFFIIYLYLPFVYIFNSPLVLYFSQVLIWFIAGIYLIRLISEEIYQTKILIFLIFILNPQLSWSLRHGFYFVDIGSYLFIILYYYLIRNKYKKVILFSILIALCQEFLVFPLIIILFIFYTREKQKSHYKVILPIVLFIYFFINFFYLIPKHSNFVKNHEVELFYGYLGTNFKDIVTNFFLHFNKVLKVLFVKEKILFLILLLVPYFFISLGSFLIISSIIHFSISLLSVFPSLYDIRVSYSTPINIVLFLSVLDVFFYKKLKIKNKYILFIFIFILLSFYYRFSASIFSYQYNSINKCSKLNLHKQKAFKIIKNININFKNKKICVSDKYSIYFSDFIYLTSFPHFYKDAEIIFVDKKIISKKNNKILEKIIKSNKYDLILNDNDFVILKKI